MESNSDRRRSAWPIAATVAVVILLAAILFSVVSCSNMMGSAMQSLGLAAESTQGSGVPHVAVIRMSGTIEYDGSECSPSGLGSLLDTAASDDSVKAVVLNIDSGGGTAAAGEEMSALVRDFEKPIVVSSDATNASAAYEISSQSDYIFVTKSSAVGSIGVAMQITDLSGLYEMLGISIEDIVSAESKDSTYGNRELTADEREWYQHMVDQLQSVFVETVAEGRGMDIEEVEELANGLAYTGIDAVENGLADEIGYLDDAVAKAAELAGYDRGLPSKRLKLPTPSTLSSVLGLFGESIGSSIGESIAGSAVQDRSAEAIG